MKGANSIDILHNIKSIEKELKQLEIILLNLRIESARIHEPNSVGVVSDKMDAIIKNIEDEINQIGELT